MPPLGSTAAGGRREVGKKRGNLSSPWVFVIDSWGIRYSRTVDGRVAGRDELANPMGKELSK